MAPRKLLIQRGRLKAEGSILATIEWPAITGNRYPCSVGQLNNSKKLTAQGGGMSLFDDAIVTLRAELFAAGPSPGENEFVKLRLGEDEPWRDMRIEMVGHGAGGGTVQLNLVAASQAA